MSMNLKATSIGIAVPRPPFKAVIQSVFASAANLAVDGSPALVTIFESDTVDLPQGICLASGSGFAQAGLSVGQEVECLTGALSVSAIGLRIALEQARVWSGWLEAGELPCGKGSIQPAWQIVAEALRLEKTRCAVASPQNELLEQKLAARLRLLAYSACVCDLQEARTAASQLVGLGIGLTPSGDDILTGFMAGLWAGCGRDAYRQRFARQFAGVLTDLSARTNRISQTYLNLAAKKQFSSSLVDLARSICQAEQPGTTLVAARKLFEHGHTSGMDSTAGLLWGLAAWSEFYQATLPAEKT